MRASRAFAAGVAGGIVMTILMWLGRTMMGMPMNLSMMEGTMFMDPGPVAWMMGFIMHLIISGLIGLIYAWAFENVVHRAGAGVGAGFGIIHAIIAGIVMGFVPLMHPRMPDPMMPPGFFLSAMGMMGVVALFVLHIVYGAVVGGVYGHVSEVPNDRMAAS